MSEERLPAIKIWNSGLNPGFGLRHRFHQKERKILNYDVRYN